MSTVAREIIREKFGCTYCTGCNLWEADHRLRVANGGGECDEDNIDTLCLRCH
eukprot:COSAG06_NODE_43770_length_369_cov_0.637037_1_plen_52_part_10